MKIHIYFFLLLFSISSYASEKVALKYFKNVQEAEWKITIQQYDSALYFYKLAFNVRKDAKDLLNAAFCALYEKEYDDAQQYLILYLKKGGKFYYNETEFVDFFPGLPQSIKSTIRAFNRPPITPTGLGKTLDSLRLVDQHYHQNRESIGIDSMHHYDKTNYEYLMGIIRKHGFPIEEDVVLDTYSIANRSYEVLFVHFIQAGLFTYEDLAILKQALFDDKLSPITFSVFANYFFQRDLYGYRKVVRYFTTTDRSAAEFCEPLTVTIKTTEEEMQFFNKNRAEIGLLPFTEHISCITFGHSKNPFYFTTPWVTGEKVSIKEYNQILNQEK